MKEYSLDCPYYTRTFSTLDDLLRDIIMTGTPEGVGAMVPGDVCEVSIAGLGKITTTIGPKADA